jgi:hypothetical protein
VGLNIPAIVLLLAGKECQYYNCIVKLAYTAGGGVVKWVAKTVLEFTLNDLVLYVAVSRQVDFRPFHPGFCALIAPNFSGMDREASPTNTESLHIQRCPGCAKEGLRSSLAASLGPAMPILPLPGLRQDRFVRIGTASKRTFNWLFHHQAGVADLKALMLIFPVLRVWEKLTPSISCCLRWIDHA